MRLRSRVRSFSQISGHLHTTRAQSTAAEHTSEAGGGPTMDMVRTIRPQLGPASATARSSWLVTSPTEGIVFVTSVNLDRKSTRLNSSHVSISYAVFCLKTKK